MLGTQWHRYFTLAERHEYSLSETEDAGKLQNYLFLHYSQTTCRNDGHSRLVIL